MAAISSRNARRPLAVLVALASLACSLPARAALVPTSDELVVNTHTDGAQINPSVAETADGGFVVVWQDNRFDNEGIHVRARRLAPDLAPLAADLRVDAASDTWNRTPDVATLLDGDLVVVWRRGVAGGEIVARKLAADGTIAGEEFRIDSPRQLGEGTAYLGAPSVAASSDGGFAVAWASGKTLDFTLKTEVYVRAFSAAGAPKSEEQALDSGDARAARFPDLQPDGDGGYVIAWTAGEFSPSIRAQRLDADGVPTGEQLEHAGGFGARIAAGAGSRYHVLFSNTRFLDEYSSQVLGVTFEAGTFSAPFEVTRYGDRGVSFPEEGLDIAAITTAAGDIIVAHELGSPEIPFDGDDSAIAAHAFDGAGYPADLFGLVLNSTTAGAQIDPELARISGNRFIAVWESDIGPDTIGDSGEVYARTFEFVPPGCGDATIFDGRITAADALVALQAAVGVRHCLPCLCDADDSGDISATDALALLRASVGTESVLHCPHCPLGRGTELTLDFAGECHGAHVEIPATALPQPIEEFGCFIDTQLLALPCVLTGRLDQSGWTLDFRSHPNDPSACSFGSRPVLSCHLDDDALAAMAAAAVVTCGCGCAEECPTPRLCAPGALGTTCSSVADMRTRFVAAVQTSATTTSGAVSIAAFPGSAVGASAASSTSVQSASTSSLSCGTCCFTPLAGEITLEDAVTVTELRVRVQGDLEPTCTYCDAAGSDVILGEDSLEFCIFRPDGIEGPVALASCFANDGTITPGPAEVLRARGPNFEPIDPPSVVSDF